MKKFKRMMAVAGLLYSALCIPHSSLAQGVPPAGTFQANNLNLPFAVLTSASGVIATNLAAGWSLIQTNTLISTTWNSSSNAFITVTNNIFTTNTSFADMPIQMQKDLAMVFTQSASSAGTNVFTFARGLSTSVLDTNSPITVTVGQTAAGFQTLSTNISAALNGGFGLVRLISVAWTPASGGGTVTNGVVGGGVATNNIPALVTWAVKRNAW